MAAVVETIRVLVEVLVLVIVVVDVDSGSEAARALLNLSLDELDELSFFEGIEDSPSLAAESCTLSSPSDEL